MRIEGERMNDTESGESPAIVQGDTLTPDSDGAGIVLTRLAEMNERTILDEAALADALGIVKRTVRRMVSRFELPPPMRIAGRSRWFAGKVLDWFEAEADRQTKKAEAKAAKLRKYSC